MNGICRLQLFTQNHKLLIWWVSSRHCEPAGRRGKINIRP